METVVKRWGNSAAIRIPAGVLADSGIEVDQPVDIRQERGRIVIEPSSRRTWSIRDLVSRIRKDNLHGPVDTGDRVGREVW